jgi:hypothetical protein
MYSLLRYMTARLWSCMCFRAAIRTRSWSVHEEVVVATSRGLPPLSQSRLQKPSVGCYSLLTEDSHVLGDPRSQAGGVGCVDQKVLGRCRWSRASFDITAVQPRWLAMVRENGEAQFDCLLWCASISWLLGLAESGVLHRPRYAQPM